MAGSRARFTRPDVHDESEDSLKNAVQKIQAIPFSGGTTVVVRQKDFQGSANIEHDDVKWDYRIDNFCVTIGEGISQEAAQFLATNYPNSFRIIEG